jgi:hypothetical protein
VAKREGREVEERGGSGDRKNAASALKEGGRGKKKWQVKPFLSNKMMNNP